MDVSDLKDRKKRLEAAIMAAIATFESDTRVDVKGVTVDIMKVQAIIGKPVEYKTNAVVVDLAL